MRECFITGIPECVVAARRLDLRIDLRLGQTPIEHDDTGCTRPVSAVRATAETLWCISANTLNKTATVVPHQEACEAPPEP